MGEDTGELGKLMANCKSCLSNLCNFYVSIFHLQTSYLLSFLHRAIFSLANVFCYSNSIRMHIATVIYLCEQI